MRAIVDLTKGPFYLMIMMEMGFDNRKILLINSERIVKNARNSCQILC
jgi:hypothetical protein